MHIVLWPVTSEVTLDAPVTFQSSVTVCPDGHGHMSAFFQSINPNVKLSFL